MKKLNALLHDVTVINFRVVSKLFLRFYKVTLVFGLIALIAIPYFYLSQRVIYQKDAYFKVLSPLNETKNSNAISDLIESSTNFMKKPEILALVSDFGFVSTMVDEVMASPDFKDLDFNSPSMSVKGSLVEESHAVKNLKSCKDANCQKKHLREILPSLFVLDSELTTSKFKILVTTYSEKTTSVILRSFKTALEKTRHKEISEALDQQVQQIQDLISKSRSEIELKGGFEKVASRDFLSAQLEEKRLNIQKYSEKLNFERDQLNFQSIRLKQSSIAAHSEIESDEKLVYEKYSKLKRRVEELRQNVASISSLPVNSRTESDEQILKQLKVELTSAQIDLDNMGSIKRNVAHDDSFINTQVNNQVNFEFDYKVANAKLKRLESDYQKAKKELDDLYVKNSSMANELLTLQPDLEYLKLLEGKLVSLKMKRSALHTDVSFDEFSNDVYGFKKNSLTRIILFSFVLAFFLTFLTVILFYLFDDRIHDREELEKCCADLPVLGNVPSFD